MVFTKRQSLELVCSLLPARGGKGRKDTKNIVSSPHPQVIFFKNTVSVTKCQVEYCKIRYKGVCPGSLGSLNRYKAFIIKYGLNL